MKNSLHTTENKLTKFISKISNILGIKEFLKSLLKFSSISYWKYRDTLFLIYTMGKVGSTSISHTVQAKFRYSKVYHVHYLSKYWLEVARTWDTSENNSWIRQANIVKPILETSKKIKIITVVRDPVSVHISGEFENSIEFGDDLINTEVSEVVHYIKKKGFDYPSRWFKDELFDLIQLDIKDLDVFSEKGYTICGKENMEVLFLKFESLNNIVPKALSEFLGVTIESIASKNRTKNKSTNKLYENVLSDFSLPEAELELIYGQPILQRAYSEKEIEEFKTKWRD